MYGSAGLAREFGSFIASTDGAGIPDDARTIASRAFADTLGVAIAGTTNPIGQRIVAHVHATGTTGESPLFTGDADVQLLDSVLANSTLAHCIDFDDTNHPLYGHPSSVLIPVTAGLGQSLGTSGADLVTAYLIGHEVEIAFARAINHDHYAQGFHATGSLGVFAAAAAAARLLDLTAAQAGEAIALAASMSGGIRANIGSMTKPIHAGMAAMNGIRAAQLAQAGWESSADALEREHTGYFATYAVGKTPDIAAALDPLGSSWAIAEPFGQQVKPFPACGATHPASEAAIEVHGLLGGDFRTIAAIEVGVCSLVPGILVYDNPQSGHEARFSLTYPVSRALVSGRVGIDSFQPDAIFDPDVRALMQQVEYHVDDRVRDSSEFGAIVSVTTKDGDRVEARSDYALGKNAKPMSEAQLREKFDGCLRLVNDTDGDDLWTVWRGIDGEPGAQTLWDAVAAWWP